MNEIIGKVFKHILSKKKRGNFKGPYKKKGETDRGKVNRGQINLVGREGGTKKA